MRRYHVTHIHIKKRSKGQYSSSEMEHVWIITSKVFSKMSQICSASMYVSGYVSHVKSLPYSPINRCNVVQHNIAPCPTTRRTYSARQSTTFGRAFWYQPLKRKMECNTVWPYAECIQHEYKPLYDHMPKVFGTLVEYVQRSILQARITFGRAYCRPDINY